MLLSKSIFKLTATCIQVDSDLDGIADQLDSDSDNDGILDNVEFMSQNYADAPCILGSVVHISQNSHLSVPSYSRKLKMLRAELFSLLSCSHSIKIVNSYK